MSRTDFHVELPDRESEENAGPKLGSATDMRELSTAYKLRFYATIRNVWQLTAVEKSHLTSLRIRQTTGISLLNYLNEQHEWKDRIEVRGVLYDLHMIDMTVDWLEADLKERKVNDNIKLLVSLRENNTASTLRVALVKKVLGAGENLSYQQLYEEDC